MNFIFYRYIFINILCLCFSLMSAIVRGDDSSLILKGTVIEQGCTVDAVDVDKTVNLGEWSTRLLMSSGGHSVPVDFTIKLTDCTSSGVALTFTGDADAGDSTLLALNGQSTATGVAVEIMDSSHKRLSLNEKTDQVAVDGNGNVNLNFAARYFSQSGRVTAGMANADSVFTLTYD